MKTKNLILGVVAGAVALVAVKWSAVTPAPQTETAVPVTGRTAPAVAQSLAPATVTATPTPPVASAETATPALPAEVAGTVAAPAAASAAVAPLVEEEPEAEPEPAIADFGTGRAHDRGLVSNQAGDFPRVLIEPGAVVPVTVAYPGTAAGEGVAVSVMDGGNLDGAEVARVVYLDRHGQLHFAFHCGQSLGIYRVTLRHGAAYKTLQFWAGPPQEIATTPLPKGSKGT